MLDTVDYARVSENRAVTVQNAATVRCAVYLTAIVVALRLSVRHDLKSAVFRAPRKVLIDRSRRPLSVEVNRNGNRSRETGRQSATLAVMNVVVLVIQKVEDVGRHVARHGGVVLMYACCVNGGHEPTVFIALAVSGARRHQRGNGKNAHAKRAHPNRHKRLWASALADAKVFDILLSISSLPSSLIFACFAKFCTVPYCFSSSFVDQCLIGNMQESLIQ